MITSCGKAYTTSPVPSQDLQYNGSFTNATSIQWAAESAKWHSTAVIPSAVTSSNNTGDTYLQIYGDAYLSYAGNLSLPVFTVGPTAYAGHGRYVFWSNMEDKLIVLEQADATANLTADYGVTVYPLTTPPPGCSYSLGASSASFDSTGGLNTVNVTTGAACTWDAVSGASWITVNSGAIGFGPNTVGYTVASNTGTTSRMGTITIAGNTFTVTQASATYFTLTPLSVVFASAGGPGLVTVTANPASAPWTAVSNDSWITIQSGSSGTGNGEVSYTAAANNTGSSRSGTIAIAGHLFSVYQAPSASTFSVSKAGIWQNAFWVIDSNNNHQYDGPPSDKLIQWGFPGVMPVYGDWNGSGTMKGGLYYQGFWYLDYNGDGIFEPGIDKVYYFGAASSTPIVGDWNGNGRTKIGIYQSGIFILDTNGDGVYEPGTDSYFGWGPTSGAQPVLGDWNGDGRTKVGVFQQGFWALDYNGNGIYEPGTDKFLQWGQANGIPVVGDWNGSGTTKIGSWSLGPYGPNVGQFVLDVNGDYAYEPGTDAAFAWGDGSSIPVVGDWNGDGRTKIGVFSNGFWVLDSNGDFMFEAGTDATFQLGGCGAQAYPCGQVPVPGKW